MYAFVLVIHIIVSLVLVATILLQAGKGGGLAETFGGGGGSQTTIFGQKASTFLTKATTVSAVLFLCTSLTLALLSSKRKKSLMEGIEVKTSQPLQEQVPLGDVASEEAASARTAVEQAEEAFPAVAEQVEQAEEAPLAVGETTTPEAKPAPVAGEEEPPISR